jgi:hypothetical protein
MHELLNICQTLLGQAGQLVSPQYFLAIHRKKIFGAWLVQIQGGGHGALYQYPDIFSRVVLTFLET